MLTVTLLSGCKEKEEKVSEEEAKKFATYIKKEVDDFKINFLETNIHVPLLLERIKSTSDKKLLSGFETGIKKGLSSNNYEKSIYNIMAGTGSFELVNQYAKEGAQHIIFRVYGPNGLNYLDMELAKYKKKVGIADIFLQTTGENLSKSMGELAEKLLSHEGSSTEQHLIDVLNRIKKYTADKEYEKAKAEFQRLPYSLRNDRMYEVTYLEILSNISQEEYMAELEKITKKYEGQPGYDLMLLDVYLTRKDFDKALKAIDGVDSTVKGDPFLDYYRGLVHNMNDDKEKAVVYFEKVAKVRPDFADNYAELVAHYASRDDKANARKYYVVYKKMKGKNPEVINFYEAEYPFLAE